jgi:hypothetical protein
MASPVLVTGGTGQGIEPAVTAAAAIIHCATSTRGGAGSDTGHPGSPPRRSAATAGIYRRLPDLGPVPHRPAAAATRHNRWPARGRSFLTPWLGARGRDVPQRGIYGHAGAVNTVADQLWPDRICAGRPSRVVPPAVFRMMCQQSGQ